MKNTTAPIITILTSFFLLSCSGSVEMTNLQLQNGNKLPDDGIKGVVVYPPALFVETYKTTLRVDKKTGALLATAPDCVPVVSEQLVIRADFNNPRNIRYNPAFLESNKFGVGIQDGLLKSVNSESSPDRGETLKNLTGAATDIAALTAQVGPSVCNDGKVFYGIRRVNVAE